MSCPRALRGVLCALIVLVGLGGFARAATLAGAAGAKPAHRPVVKIDYTSPLYFNGRVIEADTRRPIEGVLVRVLETGQAVRTGADGTFAFPHLPAGRYTVSLHHVAYADLERPVRVAGEAERNAVQYEFRLAPALYRAAEVVVRGERSSTAAGGLPYAAATLTDEALRDQPVVTLSDAAGALPGIALERDGTWGTAIAVRGLSHYSVVTSIDGSRIETATEHAGGLSLVDVQELERIEVMKTSGSVLGGSGALGGSVQLVSRRAAFRDLPRWGGEFTEGWSNVDASIARHVALEHADDRHALRLAGSFRDAGDTWTPRGRLYDSHYRDWALNGSLGLRTWGRQVLTLLYQRVQAEDTGIPGGAPFPTAALVTYPLARREMAGIEYTIPNPSPRIALITARASRQVIERDVNLVQTPTVYLTPHATHTTTSGSLEARFVPGGGHLLVAGGELWHRTIDSWRERHLLAQNKLVGERPLPLAAYMSGGAFLQDEWNLVPERARLVLGARWDKSRTHSEIVHSPEYAVANGHETTTPAGQFVMWPGSLSYDQSWSASAGLNVKLAAPLTCSALIATAFRSPEVEERFAYLDLGSSLHVGNPTLSPEKSVSANVGTRLQFAHTWLQVDAFGNRLEDLVTELPGTFEGRAAYIKENVGQARLYGFEASGEQRLMRGVALSGSVACTRGEDTGAHVNLPQIAPLAGRGELDIEAGRAGTLQCLAIAQHTQGNPGAGETATAGWTTWNVRFASRTFAAGSGRVRFRGGVDNVLDRAYRLHLSTLRGIVKLEPGRNLFLAATAEF